jgi:trk system potassium uptake protein TrkA
MKRFVVIGLGNFGSAVAESLHRAGHDVTTVDVDEDAVERVAPNVARAAVGDGRNPKVLEGIGASRADAAVVSTGDDITASILSTMVLHDLGVREVYVKVISRDHARVMERMGVTESIFPERESALALGTRMCGAALLNYVRLGRGFGVQEMAVPQAWNGQTLRQLELRPRYGITVLAIHDVLRDEIIAASDPDAVLKDSDTLLVAGRDEDLSRVAQVE